MTPPARPTSEPVPAVVGTATTGAMPRRSARVHQSPTSSKSQSGRVCPDMKAITLPASSAEPPPKAPGGLSPPRQEGHPLPAIDPRAAAEGNPPVVSAGAIGRQPRLDIGRY